MLLASFLHDKKWRFFMEIHRLCSDFTQKAMDAAHPVYLTFEGNKPGLGEQAPSRIEDYALEAFKKIHVLMQENPAAVKDLLTIADTVHQQLSTKIFEASFDVLQSAQSEYAKLQEMAAPPPPRPSGSAPAAKQYKTVKENKQLLSKFTKSLANMLQPYALDNKKPEAVKKEFTFNNFLTFFPRLNFTADEKQEFVNCRNAFYAWKESYVKYCEQLETIEEPIARFDFLDKSRITGAEMDQVVKQIEGSKEEILKVGELAKRVENEFSTFFIQFMRFVSKDHSLNSFEEAVDKFSEQRIAVSTKGPVDELKEFGGIHAAYKTFLLNAKINQGTGWLNTLLEVYGAKEGSPIKVADFANWLKKAAGTLDQYPEEVKNKIRSALDRIGHTQPDKNFADFFKKNFPKLNQLQYPFKMEAALSGDMKKEFDLLNNDQGLQEWLDKVGQTFSKEAGWPKTDVHRLKEQAVLIHCLDLNANPVIAAKAKAAANAIVAYYLKEELSTKHQQII